MELFALQPFVRRLALIVVAVLMSCVGAATAMIMLRPVSINSYEDQVADALHQQRISYQEIELGERWPDHINFQYGANVFPYSYHILITLADGAKTDGWLSCAQLERACTLSIMDLELRDIPVRDFSTQRHIPVLGGLLAYLHQVLP